MKGKKSAGDDSAADTNGPVYKEVRPVKLDFSATNFKANVTGWRLSIEKKIDTLFPAVCDRARSIAGVAAASAATADSSEYQDPQILARANLASEDEEDNSDGGIHDTHEDTGTRAHSGIDEDQVDEHHDNRLRVDEHHNNGVDDDHRLNNEDDDGHDNRLGCAGDNGIGEDDEDDGSNSKANLGDGNDGDNEEEEIYASDREEEPDQEDSVLTEISFESSASDATSTSSVEVISGRKGVQRR